MKKIILTVFALTSAVFTFAQHEPGELTLYPRLGMSVYTISNSELLISENAELLKSKYKVGLTAGAEAKYQFTNCFAASAGLLYTMQGERFKHDGDSQTGSLKMTQTLHYVNVPVLAIFDLSSRLSLKCGVQVGYLLKAHSSTELGSVTNNNGEVVDDKSDGDVTNVFNRFDFSIPVGISYEYRNIALDLRYNIGVTKVYKYADDKSFNRGFMITLGYGIPL